MNLVDWLAVDENAGSDSGDLDELISTAPIPIPPELLRLLERQDGAQFIADTVLTLPDGSVAGALSMLSARESATKTGELSRTHNAIFCGRDGSGNYLVLNEEGVGFWDHDWDEVVLLGRNLNALTDRLSRPQKPSEETLVTISKYVGAPPDLRTKILEKAVDSDDARFLSELLEANEVVSERIREMTLWASSWGSTEVLKLLLIRLGDANVAFERTGRTALMHAATSGQRDCARILIEFGADRTLRDRRGKSAQELAYMCMHDDVAAYLAGLE